MTIVETASGPVQGREKDGALLFAGIPYAAPPIGPLRFRAAEPPESWRDVRPATRFGPAAPQTPTCGLTANAPVRWDEDCLSLNVCTPGTDDARRPVLVWIHGGGFRNGQGAVPWYNGARFALHGNIVVVSINYRLGAFGFTDLSTFDPAFADSGAVGLLDQITALQWVRDNIARFGGDPGKVTIAGESAGAFSVCTLLASPLCEGLFRGAIAQSGGAHHVLPAAAGRQVAERLLRALDVETPKALQSVSGDALLAAQNRIIDEIGEGTGALEAFGVPVAPFYPVVGNRAVPVPPLEALAAGASRGVTVLAGSNRDETTLFGYGDTDDAGLERIAERYGARSALDAYRRARPGSTPGELLIAFTTDHLFRIPVIRVVEARIGAGAAPNWLYWFCWRSRAFGGKLGATHALEIPFAFDNLDRAGVDVFLGPGEKPQALADGMHRAWIGFVRDLDPGWPAYDLVRRPTMRFDTLSAVVDDPEAIEREAWAELR
jgi:para-nitrobenzyl esterase